MFQKFEMEIVNQVHIMDKYLDGARNYNVERYGQGLRPRYLNGMSVGGDEGCACLYFNMPHDLRDKVDESFTRNGPASRRGSEDILFEISTEKCKDGYHFQFLIVEKDSVYAALTVDGIPKSYLIPDYGNYSQISLEKTYIPQALWFFLSTNIWMVGIRQIRWDRFDSILNWFFSEVRIP